MEYSFFIRMGFLNLGPWEIMVVMLVAVMLFGGRLPKIARTVGKGFFDFKKNIRDLQDEVYRQDYDPPKASLPKHYAHDEPDDNKTPEEDKNDD